MVPVPDRAAYDADLRAKRKPQPILGRSRVDIGRRRCLRLTHRSGRRRKLLHESFRVAHGERSRNDLTGGLPLGRGVGQRQQRARMPHRQRTCRKIAADFFRQSQQAQVVGDRGTILSDRRRNLLLRQTELIDEALIGERFVDRIEVFTLQILDERQFE